MSEKIGQLKVTIRSENGKGAARRLRRSGMVPAVVYGQGRESTPIAFGRLDLQHAIDPERRDNTLFQLQFDDGHEEICVLADYDRMPVRDDVLHVDFLRVDPEQEVARTVPVIYEGRSVGVSAGGKLKTLRRELRVRCKANAIPVHLSVDVTPLDAGQSLRVRDLPVQDGGLVIVERPDATLALVEGAKAAVEEEEKAAEAPAAAS